MMHPDVIVKKSKIKEKGLFAKKEIPKGTILWRASNFKKYTKKQYDRLNKKNKEEIRKYAYEDENGNLFLCKGIERYWNHSCNPNCSYSEKCDVDIAIRDIKKGQELTYDYALLSPKWLKPMKCNCRYKNCRKLIKRLPDNSPIAIKLNKKTDNAAKFIKKVKQPLLIRGKRKK